VTAGSGPTLARCALTTGRYTVTTVDLRGHGRSARSTVYTVQAFADDLLDTLPVGVDALGSHSLGGAVTARAVPELLPRRAAYLDPGFSIALPTTGVGGQLVRRARWTIPLFALLRSRGIREPALTDSGKVLEAAGRQLWDQKMALAVLQDVALHPTAVDRPVVLSAVVLSGDAPHVVPPALADELVAQGWDARRIDTLGHGLFLEDPELVWAVLEDLI